jgi:hypothetical protein
MVTPSDAIFPEHKENIPDYSVAIYKVSSLEYSSSPVSRLRQGRLYSFREHLYVWKKGRRTFKVKMAGEEINPGSFPVLNDGIYGEVTTAVHEIPCEGLREIDRFCLNSESKVSLFFMAVWSVVLRQYTETDVLCFGINDGNVSSQDSSDKDCEQYMMLACQVAISPGTYVRDLLKNQGDQIRVITGEPQSTYNTGVVLAGRSSSYDPTTFLDRSDGDSVSLSNSI